MCLLLLYVIQWVFFRISVRYTGYSISIISITSLHCENCDIIAFPVGEGEDPKTQAEKEGEVGGEVRGVPLDPDRAGYHGGRKITKRVP